MRSASLLGVLLGVLFWTCYCDYLGDGVDPLTYGTKQLLLQFTEDRILTENILSDNMAHHSQTIKWDNEYRLERTLNIEAKASVWKLSGSYEENRKYIHEQTSTATHMVTQDFIRMVTFQKTLNFDGLMFVGPLEQRLTEIGYMLTHGTNRSIHRANYEMARILDIYGAAIVYKKIEGGVAVMYRTVDTNKASDMTQESISRTASASFMSFVSGKVSYSVSETEKHSLEQATVAVEVNLVGGRPIKLNESIYDWQQSVFSYPATHSMSAFPWSDLITIKNLPRLSAMQVQAVRQLQVEQVQKYFEQNTKVGCMDPSSPKYMYLANKHDPARCLYEYRSPLGGFFQTSSNTQVVPNVLNEVTQSFSCPTHFTQVLISESQIPQTKCVRRCHRYLFRKSCYDVCQSDTPVVTKAFVCTKMNQTDEPKGVYFGGIYTDNSINDVTGDKRCPDKFRKFTLRIGNPGMNMHVCLIPFDAGAISNGIPFGGLFSTSLPNPLIFEEKAFHCPMGFERHYIGSTPDSQQWFYCAGLNSARPDMVVLPPGYGMEDPSLYDYYEMANGTLIPVDMANPIPYSLQADVFLNQLNFSSVEHFQNHLPNIMLAETTEYILAETEGNESSSVFDDQNLSAKTTITKSGDSPPVVVALVSICCLLGAAVVALIVFFIRQRNQVAQRKWYQEVDPNYYH